MATIIAQTEWHGNPRPVLAYATSVEDGVVASPYYGDGRDVPVIKHYVTTQPLSNLSPSASADVAGPSVLVEFSLGGLWQNPTTLTVLLTTVGSDDVSGVWSAPAELTGPVEAAQLVSDWLNVQGAGDILCASEGEKVLVSAINTTTSITITTLTVA